jgi:carbon-monoxide dehydrogenase large subunit
MRSRRKHSLRPERHQVTIDRFFVVDDLGRIINPMIIKGQQQGGVVQGIGQALLEHQVYDRQSGQLLTGSFMDYAVRAFAAKGN